MTPAALELDCTDLLCPMPVIQLGRRYTEVAVGELVAVLARDVAARVDVPAWCRMRGQEYVGEEMTTDQVPRHLVRRIS
ncbi:sulfurtransferase TusA family protein [Nocardioides yefusunii]|uniref:Sulfurtransferase TusA family protein n=1 Tax=Nocardioides yefusunii TaxID=2500546 RepID=A0ABW1QWC9_9ACTN|nr:sulfurtransferase TusA family protein [Nocardioides yefusunii]